jgi:hypothetical protein
MKITHRHLRKIINEEINRLHESIDTSLNREDAEYAYDKLSVRLRGDDDEVLDRDGTVQKLMTDPSGFDDLKQQIMQAMTHGHLKQNRAWDTAKTYWKEKLGLNEAIMVSLKPITDRPAPTQKSRWAKLSGIPEEHINLSESIMDTTAMEDLMANMAGEIVDRFGNEMTRLYDEEPDAFASQQPGGSMGRIDKSEWLRKVGSAEIALEDELQQVMTRAVETVETRLHRGDYDKDNDVSSMGGRDDYPKSLGYKHPGTGEQVMISVQSSDDMDDILDPLLRQYPDLAYSID